jgi:outer membrane protein OmpA-like peptidoglycan-associated protein
MQDKNTSFFWPSYTDLMTSMFFVMLVLYVLSYVKLKREQEATEQQLQKIKEIEEAVQNLPQDDFEYDATHRRHRLREDVNFDKGSDVISEFEDQRRLERVGRNISKLISNLQAKYRQSENDNGRYVRYVVIVEGSSSNDGYRENDVLSYKRALAVKKLWMSRGIKLDTTICEVQISGSGIEGVGRLPRDVNNVNPQTNDYKNQRILIQILPKIGSLDSLFSKR